MDQLWPVKVSFYQLIDQFRPVKSLNRLSNQKIAQPIFLATSQLSNKPKNIQNWWVLGEIYLKSFETYFKNNLTMS